MFVLLVYLLMYCSLDSHYVLKAYFSLLHAIYLTLPEEWARWETLSHHQNTLNVTV